MEILVLIVIILLVMILRRLNRLALTVKLPEEEFLQAVERTPDPLVLRAERWVVFGVAYQYITHFKGQRIKCEASRKIEFPKEVDELEVSRWE
jgi:hypothetical protein